MDSSSNPVRIRNANEPLCTACAAEEEAFLTREEYATRLRDACRHVNEKHEVTDLCNRLPQRLQEVVDAEGDRISH